MEKMLKTLIILSSVMGIALSQNAFAEKLRLIGVGDLHELNANKQGRGGYAKFASLVKNSKSNIKNVLVIHAGDAFSPSVEALILRGAQAVDLLNAIGIDYFTPGNHEFDFGVKRYRELVNRAKFKVVVSNLLNEKGKLDSNVIKSDLIEIAGTKIGIYGLITPRSGVLSSMDGYRFMDLLETGQKMHEALRSQGAEFVIAISHTNITEDLQLFNAKVADVIISGDDHSNVTFTNGKGYWFESGEDAEQINVLDLDLVRDKKGRLRTDGVFKVYDTADLNVDPDMQKKIDVIMAKTAKELAVEIGTLSTSLDSRRAIVRGSEAGIGNLIADAMRAEMQADIALTNGGGIRGNKIYDKGHKLTRRDILAELPFGNVCVKIELTGAQVLEALEHAVSKVENEAGRFAHVSGMTFVWDKSKAAGNRVVSAKVGKKKISKSTKYTLATNNYIQGGGDGYSVFKKGKVLVDASSAKLLAAIVMEHIAQQGKVKAKVEGRITQK